MRNVRLLVIAACTTACLLAAAMLGRSASAEKPDVSPQGLRDGSTHIVVGEVKGIYSRKSTEGDWRYTRYIAEIKVQSVEKGAGIEVGGLVYVRYWMRGWVGTRPMPPSTVGHRDLPIEGQVLRIYLARHAHDGFTDDNKDGGFNVLGANGFEVPLQPPASGAPLSGWLPAQSNLKIGVYLYEGDGEKKQIYAVVLRLVAGQQRVIIRYAGGPLDGAEDSLELTGAFWARMFVRRDDPALK